MKELHVKLMTTLCEFFRIKKIATRPYHPQSNSPVERYNSVISQCLRAYIDKEQNNWRKLLPSDVFSTLSLQRINTVSPYRMLCGKEMNLPFDSQVICIPKETMGKDANSILASFFENWRKKPGKTERFSETGTDSSYQQCKIKRTIFQLTGAR